MSYVDFHETKREEVWFLDSGCSNHMTRKEALAETESHLWHRRFGHLNYQGLRTLAYRKMVDGVPLLKVPEKLCEACFVGKQHRESIPKQSSWRASKQLQLVHSDLCGPIKPASNSDKRYIISFIDNFSRKTWVYFLHEKPKAFIAFKNFKACVEKEIGAHITCLRTDRGGEFNSNEFVEFCKAQGTSRQLTAAYTPQQNGVAERKNRTIMNTVHSMLSEKKVPKMFWPEDVKWCVHIQNRSQTAAVKEKTPEEAWSGVKPTVDYFWIFGCIAHARIPDQRGASWIPRVRSVYYWVLVMNPRLIDCMIQSLRRLSSAMMFYLKKKRVGIRAELMKN